VRPLPERELFQAFVFSEFDEARACLRALAAPGAPLSMLRLATPAETEISLAVADRPRRGVARIAANLALRHIRPGTSALLLTALTGTRRAVRHGRHDVNDAIHKHGGIAVPGLGPAWLRTRFRAPYLRDSLWQLGYGVDTVETATTWSAHDALRRSLEDALRSALKSEPVLAFSHLSHAYPTGANLYTTFVFRLSADPQETLARWRSLKDAASRAIVAHHATISHQHGVGVDHRPYLEAEKGTLAMNALRQLAGTFDPDHLLNPGKLFEDRP